MNLFRPKPIKSKTRNAGRFLVTVLPLPLPPETKFIHVQYSAMSERYRITIGDADRGSYDIGGRERLDFHHAAFVRWGLEKEMEDAINLAREWGEATVFLKTKRVVCTAEDGKIPKTVLVQR